MSSRGICMCLSGSNEIYGNEFIPFNHTISNWANDGSDYVIQYDESSRHFIIPHASANDYYVSWQTEIITAQTGFPILGLEFSYNEIVRNDYFMCPLTTTQAENSSLYHISTASETDLLTIGLIIIKDNNLQCTLNCPSQYKYVASMIIIGL